MNRYKILCVHQKSDEELVDCWLTEFDDVRWHIDDPDIVQYLEIQFLNETNSVDKSPERMANDAGSAAFIVFFITRSSLANQAFMDTVASICSCIRDRDTVVFAGLYDGVSEREIPVPALFEAANESQFYSDPWEMSWSFLYSAANQDAIKRCYEELAGYTAIGHKEKITECLIALLDYLCRENVVIRDAAGQRRRYFKEILRCMEALYENCSFKPEGAGQRLPDWCLKDMDALERVGEAGDLKDRDLFLLAFGIRMNYLTCSIRCAAMDAKTQEGISKEDVSAIHEKHLTVQKQLLQAYDHAAKNIGQDHKTRYPADEVAVILRVGESRIPDTFPDSAIRDRKNELSSTPEMPAHTKEQQELYDIADYMRQSNRLFELAGKDSQTTAFLKCLKTSYMRLQKYSEIAGCKDIAAECIEEIVRCNKRIERLEGPASADSAAEFGIKALLGFSVANLDDFDVFISYNHADRDIAVDLYHYLQSNMLHPFFDTFTLPELSKSDYRDAIMNALDTSGHFVVIFSDIDHIRSEWVALEMSTFELEIAEGRKKDANFLMVVTDDVYRQIMDSNKKCLAIQYRKYEIIRISEYKNVLSGYLRRPDMGRN